jgi:hypothetical protein
MVRGVGSSDSHHPEKARTRHVDPSRGLIAGAEAVEEAVRPLFSRPIAQLPQAAPARRRLRASRSSAPDSTRSVAAVATRCFPRKPH